MSKAIGMVEYKTVSAGITAADAMVKTSEVSIIEAQTVCPGKYIAIITGDLSAVKAAVDNARELHGFHLIDSFVLGNPHESIFPAIYGAARSKMYLLWESWRHMTRLRSSWRRMRLQKRRSLI